MFLARRCLRYLAIFWIFESEIEQTIVCSILMFNTTSRNWMAVQRSRYYTFPEWSRLFSLISLHFPFQVFGPNQKLHLVLHDVTKNLIKFSENVTKEEFQNAIEKENGLGLGDFPADLRTNIIRVGHVLRHDKFRCTKSLKLSDIQHFSRQLFKQLKIVALIQGNLTAEEAKSIMRTVESNLGCEKIEDVSGILK